MKRIWFSPALRKRLAIQRALLSRLMSLSDPPARETSVGLKKPNVSTIDLPLILLQYKCLHIITIKNMITTLVFH